MVRGRTNKYLKSAPSYLINLCEQRSAFPGREQLYKLLTSADMARPWQELSRRVKNDSEWENLRQEINYFLLQVKKPLKTRSQTKAPYEKVRKKINEVCKLINDEWPLDPMAYEIFPPEVMDINMAYVGRRDNWTNLDSLGRATAAKQLMRTWPSVIELLNGLANKAEIFAEQAMTTPRTVERQTRDFRRKIFSVELCKYFNNSFGSPLYGTCAKITTVILGRVDKEFVEKHWKGSQQRAKKLCP